MSSCSSDDDDFGLLEKGCFNADFSGLPGVEEGPTVACGRELDSSRAGCLRYVPSSSGSELALALRIRLDFQTLQVPHKVRLCP